MRQVGFGLGAVNGLCRWLLVIVMMGAGLSKLAYGSAPDDRPLQLLLWALGVLECTAALALLRSAARTVLCGIMGLAFAGGALAMWAPEISCHCLGPNVLSQAQHLELAGGVGFLASMLLLLETEKPSRAAAP